MLSAVTLSQGKLTLGSVRASGVVTGPAADAGRAAAQASTPSKAALAASCFGFSFILSYLLGVESAGA